MVKTSLLERLSKTFGLRILQILTFVATASALVIGVVLSPIFWIFTPLQPAGLWGVISNVGRDLNEHIQETIEGLW